MAAGSRSGGTSRGIADERAGWSSEARPAATNATANRATSGGAGWSEPGREGRAAGHQPHLGDGSSRRRSTASATEPAPSEKMRIGTSWNSVSAAIASVEPVRT